MDRNRWDRYASASGIVMVVSGAAATAFESSPVTAADYALHHDALLTQSMLFLAGAGASLWFFAALRDHLLRFEQATGRLAATAFGAGVAWAVLSMAAQSFQIGVANDPRGQAPTALLETMAALFAVSNLPLAVMLAAVAVATLRQHAFPRWLGWAAVAAAGAHALLWMSTVAPGGPLGPQGWLSLVLYPFFLVWLIPATMVMMKSRARKLP